MFNTFYLFYNKQFISFLLRFKWVKTVCRCCLQGVAYIFSYVFWVVLSHVKLLSWENYSKSMKWFNYIIPKLNIKIKSIFWISLSFLPTRCVLYRDKDVTSHLELSYEVLKHVLSSILINFSSVSPQQKMSHTGLKQLRLLNYDDKWANEAKQKPFWQQNS